MTFEQVKIYRDKFLANIASLESNDRDWCRAVGIGFTPDNKWNIAVRIKDESGRIKAEMILRAIGWTGPHDIQVVGDITAL